MTEHETEHQVPLIEGDVSQVIAELVRGQLVRSERIAATDTLRRLALGDGRVLGVKQYALGRSYAIEGAALRELAGTLPVAEIACTLDRVIAYRWIDGVTLDDCAQHDPDAVVRLAGPLGELMGRLARIARPARPVDAAPVLAQLAGGPARARLGGALADGLARLLAAERFDDPACLVHGSLDGRHVIVAPGRDRIAGVVGWQAATAGSLLRDVGSLLRDPRRRGAAFVAAFARGHGALPDDWLWRARLLDALPLIARIAVAAAPPERLGALRDALADLVADAARPDHRR